MGYFSDNELGWWSDALFLHFIKQPKTNLTRQQLIRLLRKITCAHVHRLGGEAWNKHHIVQPTHPVIKAMSMGMILSFQTQHFATHLDLIRRNLAAFRDHKGEQE